MIVAESSFRNYRPAFT